VPAIEIEAIAVAFDNEDRRLLYQVVGIEHGLQSGAEVDRHGIPAIRARCEHDSSRAKVE
jgi:hypothetical protein